MYLHMLLGFRPVEAQEAVQTQKLALCVSCIELTSCPCKINLNGDATAKPHIFLFFFQSEMQKSCFKIDSSFFFDLKAFSPINGSYHFLNKSNDYS